ncbi:hypothetical protein AB0G02_03145 [Actinosynnema sp. NPDC023658]|uniref:hypothetical protein n=1 Tax=Actinosynnema sp. NPDC023658 TaxID=3155465 RepID=UPI0033F6C619
MTRLVPALVRAAGALLPRGQRDRYREQWRADVDGARELGLNPLGVAFGALRIARREHRPVVVPVGVPAPALRLRGSTNIGAVLAVLVPANLSGGILLLLQEPVRRRRRAAGHAASRARRGAPPASPPGPARPARAAR